MFRNAPVFTSEFERNYKKEKELGKGAFGKAVLAVRRQGESFLYVKLDQCLLR
jgi:hypothetical protein